MFRRFITYTHIMESEHIIESFGDHLKYASPADEWFHELETRTMWKDVEKVFLECFPPVERAKRTETELERELCELRLKVEDLGKKEKYVGEEVYTHVIFAEKALSLAKQAKISNGSNLIWKVHDKLPDIIRQKVKETYSMWTEFCAAIKAVEMAHIWDGVKKYQKEKEEKERTEAAIAGLQCMQQQQRRLPNAPMSPMLGISQAMQSTNLGGQRNNQPATSSTPQAPAANTNPFTGPSGSQGNLFRPPPPPVTEANRDVLTCSLAAYPIQPNTTVGITAWHNQLRDWKTRNGEDAQITAGTGFPLRPGGAPPGSGECYGCGLVGHHCGNMRCMAGQINNREHTFRTICGRILCLTATPQVNLVSNASNKFDWLNDQALVPELSQGNGEGPSA